MDSKLVEAIKERIKAGHTKEQIQTEVTAIGYDYASFEAAYTAATTSGEPVLASVVNEVIEGRTSNGKDDALNISYLFSSSWQMAKSNVSLLWKTVLTFFLSLLLFVVAAAAVFVPSQKSVTEESVYILIGIAFFVVFFAISILCFGVLLRGLLRRNTGESFRTHFSWSLTHAVSIILVSIYVSIVTQVGYLFFIIPGLMLAVYLMFTTFFVVAGSQSGISAMVTSTKLVYGRFWPVLIPILLSVGVLMAAFTTIAFATIVLSLFNPFLIPVIVLLAFVGAVAGGFWQLCLLTNIFEILQKEPNMKNLPLSEKGLNTSYKVIVSTVVGLTLLIVLSVGLLVL